MELPDAAVHLWPNYGFDFECQYGLLVVILTILIARWSSALIERRIANRRHIDPGLRYTICRLVKYVIILVGSLVALKQAFAIDLTSIAVIFTALSVGIGFGLQYIAADIASGFILLFERPIRIGLATPTQEFRLRNVDMRELEPSLLDDRQ